MNADDMRKTLRDSRSYTWMIGMAAAFLVWCAAVALFIAPVPAYAGDSASAGASAPADVPSSVGAVQPAAGDTVASGSFASDPGAYWTLSNDGSLVISGSGRINEWYDASSNSAPWLKNLDQIKTVSVSGSVTTTRISYWFYDCYSLISVSLTPKFGSGCDNLAYAFAGCTALGKIDLSAALGASGVFDAQSMFEGCSNLESVSLPADMGSQANVHNMFKNCRCLTSLALPAAFGTASPNMGSLFEGCAWLGSITLPAGFGQNAKDMSSVFKGCARLAAIDLPDGFAGKATSVARMFEGCTSVQSLRVPSNFGQAATDFSNLFSEDSALHSLDVSRIDMRKAQDVSDMLKNCLALSQINLGQSFTFRGVDGDVATFLPDPMPTYVSWQAVWHGTTVMPLGKIWTAAGLSAGYKGDMADLYVWSRSPVPSGVDTSNAGENAGADNAGSAIAAAASGDASAESGLSIGVVSSSRRTLPATGDTTGFAASCCLAAMLVLAGSVVFAKCVAPMRSKGLRSVLRSIMNC